VVKAGTGTLTVVSAMTLSTTNQLLTLTTDDIDLQGSAMLNSGTANLIVHSTTSSHNISLGATPNSMQIDDDEVGGLNAAHAGLIVGDAASGDITVTGITDSNSDTLATLVLLATKPGRTVQFVSSPSSFNKGIVVQTAGGIVLSTSVTTIASPTLLRAGTGTFTITAAATLSSTNQLLTITADDFDATTNTGIVAGTSYIHITPMSQLDIGLGTTAYNMSIEADEFKAFQATGLTLGCAGINRNIHVTGISNISSNGVTGVVTLLATVDDASISFENLPSVFHSLAVQADNGLRVSTDLTTTHGSIYLDADLDNSSSSDAFNTIHFLNGTTTTARTLLTLEATGNTITYGGAVTLNAGTGMAILENVRNAWTANGTLVVNSDYDATTVGDGTLTLTASKTIDSNNSEIVVTAWDLDLLGELNAGTASVTVTAAAINQTFGFGASAREFHFSTSELERITCDGMAVGGASAGRVTVNALTAANTQRVGSILSVIASHVGSEIEFISTASTFSSVAVQAADGIRLEVDVTSTQANIVMDGDMNDSDSGGVEDKNTLTLLGNRKLYAAGTMTLDSTTGGIWFNDTGVITLLSAAGMYINDHVNRSVASQSIFLNADADHSGHGVFTLADGKRISTLNSVLTITASDIDLGILDAGNAVVQIHSSYPGMTMGIGQTEKDLTLGGPELANIAAAGLNFGNDQNASITVDGVASGGTIKGITSVLATGHTRQVVFSNTDSTFASLAVQADNGVTINTGVTTTDQTYGTLLIDGDSDNSAAADRKDRIVIAADTRLSAAEVLTLDATSGGIFYLGRLTLQGREGIILNDSMEGEEGLLTINADPDASGIGTFTIASGKIVDNKNNDIELTASDVDLFGILNAGTQQISIHAAGIDRTVGIGFTHKDMTISDPEIGRMYSRGGFTVGDIHNGDITVDGIQDENSRMMGRLTLVATKVGKTVSFANQTSTFNKGITVQAGAGIILQESLTTKQETTILSGGTGTLTIATTKSLSTTGQFLLITADDIDLQGDASISSGSAATVIAPATSKTIGIGTTTEQMAISNVEMQGIVTNGLTIGSAGVNKGVKVTGITAAGSNGISGVLTVLTTVDDSQMFFLGAASTFNALSAQADNGLHLQQQVVTSGGSLYLDGDVEDDSAEDNDNKVNFTDNLTVSSKTSSFAWLNLAKSTLWALPHFTF
jgi:hypothetical protein